jgi:hypothetical protein
MTQTYNTTSPIHPSRRQIAKAMLIALGVALTLLFAAVLPAEYGIDPLGAGKALGLMELSATKTEGDNTQTTLSPAFKAEAASHTEHKTTITLEPLQGIEYKLLMEEGSSMVYSWSSDALLSYDFHGEPIAGPAGYFQSYEATDGDKSLGGFKSPFTGTQGWYWENKSDHTATIELTAVGFFTVVGNPKNPLTQQ